MECTCRYEVRLNGNVWVGKCRLCRNAPELLRASKAALKWFHKHPEAVADGLERENLRMAIARIEGREEEVKWT